MRWDQWIVPFKSIEEQSGLSGLDMCMEHGTSWCEKNLGTIRENK